MADNNVIINKITLSVNYNWWLKRLDTKLNEPTNQNSIKVPKIVNQTNRKRYHLTLGTSVMNSPMSLPTQKVNTFHVQEQKITYPGEQTDRNHKQMQPAPNQTAYGIRHS